MIFKKVKKIDEVCGILKINYPKFDKKIILDAFSFAQKAHSGQKRLTGDDFITHPLIVSGYLAQLGLDEKTIVAALLHDVLEDTDISLVEIRDKFGAEVTNLVDGVTKLAGIKLYGKTRQIENLRKMFLAMAKDIRVVLIRLLDRLHNLETLEPFSIEKRKRIAQATLEIYAPLAERLGIGELKGELEDLAFKYYQPREYKWVETLVKENKKEREKYTKKVSLEINKKLKESCITAEIHGRAKHFYSLYKKLLSHDKDINKIYDLIALRILVNDIEDCYKVLGLIHQSWKPLLGRIKDYIAMPKPNGYKSIHTTVFCLSGKIIEIQIKTFEMHQEAEWGIAAHWHYSEKKKSANIPKEKFQWVSQLIRWQEELKNREEFSESLKIDIFKNRIFVFTPYGDVFDLPQGATPIDFAYHIHSDVGNLAIGTKVDGKMVGLDKILQNGNVVEILTSKKSIGPKRDWLNFVKTNVARHNIRGYFHKKNSSSNLEEGRKILERELSKMEIKSIKSIDKTKLDKLICDLHFENLDKMLIAVGEGTISTTQILRKLFSDEFLVKPQPKSKISRLPILDKIFKKPTIEFDSKEEGFMINFASCCNPQSGDKIIGFVTRGKGITVHKKNCRNISTVKDKDRLIKVFWTGSRERLSIPIRIVGEDRIGLLKDIAQIASNLEINLTNVSANSKNDDFIIEVTLDISDPQQILDFFRDVKTIKDIKEVERI